MVGCSSKRENCTNPNRCLHRSWEIHTSITGKKRTILKQMFITKTQIKRKHNSRTRMLYLKKKPRAINLKINWKHLILNFFKNLFSFKHWNSQSCHSTCPPEARMRIGGGMSWWNPALFSQSPSQELNLPILLCACSFNPPSPFTNQAPSPSYHPFTNSSWS